MSVQETDILVIGAGPSGLIAAREAAKEGVNVIVLEEDGEIGLPCHCAGLLSLRGLETIGLPTSAPFIKNRVRGARFFSPSGLCFTVERDEPVACVVDRCSLDKDLAGQAIEAGAKIRFNSKVCMIKRDGAGILSLEKQGLVKSKIVIDAEGVSSKILKSLGLKTLNPEYVLPGLQFDLNGVDLDPEYVEIHLSRRVAPNFFAWVIPLDGNSARVGLACKGANLKERLDRFVKVRFGEKSRLERVLIRSGLVVTCGPIAKTFDDNLMIVGDAAGQVKPTTGGGVILGGICASIAGKVAAEAVREKNYTAAFLKRYESSWKKKLGKEFKAALFARRVANRLTDRAIDKVFEVIIKENLQYELSADGDIDFQRTVILKLLKRKEILRIFPSVWRALSPFT